MRKMGRIATDYKKPCSLFNILILILMFAFICVSALISGCSDKSTGLNEINTPYQNSTSTEHSISLKEDVPVHIRTQIRIKPADSDLFKDTESGLIIFPQRGFFMGILPIPGEGQSFEEAYAQASEYADFSPVWGRPTPFYDLKNDLSGNWGKTFVEQNIRGNQMFPIIHISFIGEDLTLEIPPEMEEATPSHSPSLSDPVWRESYKKAVLEVVKTSKPLYLSIGNEVNRWYERYGVNEENPNGFQHYVSLYEDIYDSVKEISPETMVFCTFAREIVSENREADMSVISMFNPDKIDIIVLTSYPYAVKGINRPSNIPDDYYSSVLKNTEGKQLGFSEIGWPSMDAFGGEESQAEFIKEVPRRLTKEQGVQMTLLGWAWLHDLDENDTIGLIKRDGTEKIAYKVWKSISDGQLD